MAGRQSCSSASVIMTNFSCSLLILMASKHIFSSDLLQSFLNPSTVILACIMNLLYSLASFQALTYVRRRFKRFLRISFRLYLIVQNVILLSWFSAKVLARMW